MVGVFRSAEKNLGVQTADAVRSRLSQDVPLKQLWVIPKNDVTATLEASGFPTTEALAPHDARALAQLLRADEYIVGTITKSDSGGYNVSANLVLTRDNSLVQPLGSHRVDKADKASGAISKEFRDAQKAFQHERTCVNSAREQKFDAAIAAARRGIAEYPKSTLARICLANVMREQKAPADSVLQLAREVLAIDPRSRQALTIAYDAYKTAGQNDQATETLLQLVAADPTNSRLLEQVVNELAASGKAGQAVPLVNQLVSENPGDPSFLGLQMRVRLAAKDYKGGIAAGEELMRSDTASATPDLYTRLSAAALLDSQPQLAAQIAARGVEKFPANADLLVGYADVLRSAGQSQQAVEVLNRAIAANPKTPGAFATQARLYADMNQHEQALTALQQAVTNGDSAASVANYALAIGQQKYRAANTSKQRGDFETAIRYLEFANKTNSTPEGQFLLGAASFSTANMWLQEAQRLSKAGAGERGAACTASKNAQGAFVTAQANLPAGGKFNPQATQQLLQSVQQYSPYADQFAKALCK
jgi:tetratricopeptide (TPR) repeat protein